MPSPLWRSRIVGHGAEDPDQLLANPLNWRIHPAAQQAALTDVLDRVGWVRDVLVNTQTSHVIDGHLRIALASRRGEPTVPVIYVDLTEDEEKLVLASLDPLSEMAVPDAEQLRVLLADLEQTDQGEGLANLFTTLAQQAHGTDEVINPPPGVIRQSLAERFGVPPFTVLDARQGYWQARKRAWLALGIQSELGRGLENPSRARPETTSTIDFYSQKRELEAEAGRELTKDEAAAAMAKAGTLKSDRGISKKRRARKQGFPHGPTVTQNPDGTLNYRGPQRSQWTQKVGE